MFRGLQTGFDRSLPAVAVVLVTFVAAGLMWAGDGGPPVHEAKPVHSYEGPVEDSGWGWIPCCCPTFPIRYPAHVAHGQQLDTVRSFHNCQYYPFCFEVSVLEETGPEGWLGVSGLDSGRVEGYEFVTCTLHLNMDGMVNQPGETVYLKGALLFTPWLPYDTARYDIELWVVDSFIYEEWDTLSTGCMSLVLGNTGNAGNAGQREVSMDFFNYDDCDSATYMSDWDTLPGASYIYLYDASPVVCWKEGDSVVCNWSVFDDGPRSPTGMFPIDHGGTSDGGEYSLYRAASVTNDSSLKVERLWYAPKDPSMDSCRFLVQGTRYYSHDGSSREGVLIAEVLDWDIPSDSKYENRSGFDSTRSLIFQQGSEHDDDPEECQENSDRYGGISCLEILHGDELISGPSSSFYGCYTIDARRQVYPAEGLVPDSVWKYTGQNSGFSISDSVDADLLSFMTYWWDVDIAAEDTLTAYSCWVTSHDGYDDFIASVDACRHWYKRHTMPNRAPILHAIGDRVFFVDSACTLDVSATDPNVDVLTFIAGPVAEGASFTDFGDNSAQFVWTPTLEDCGDYVVSFQVKDAEFLRWEDVFIRVTSSCCRCRGDVDHSGEDHPIDISDLVYLVDYIFADGPEPPCMEEADVDASGSETLAVADVVLLVEHMFTNGSPLPPCSWQE